MPTTVNRDSLLSFANSHRDEYESLLRRFVETPTVSVDPNHLEDIKKGVECAQSRAMDSVLTLVFLPIALGIIMLGLGLSLTIQDFRRVAAYPAAALVALTCQVVLLPAVSFGLALAFDLKPELAVGMMLLAASPGGTTANLYSHLFGGNVALNVTLTATPGSSTPTVESESVDRD